MDKHIEEEHFDDMEAFSLESNEENLVHFCSACPLRYIFFFIVYYGYIKKLLFHAGTSLRTYSKSTEA